MPSVEDASRPGPLDTLTHARLRLRQGDLDGALRILSSILAADPEHDEARRTLDATRRLGAIRRLERFRDAVLSSRGTRC